MILNCKKVFPETGFGVSVISFKKLNSISLVCFNNFPKPISVSSSLISLCSEFSSRSFPSEYQSINLKRFLALINPIISLFNLLPFI